MWQHRGSGAPPTSSWRSVFESVKLLDDRNNDCIFRVVIYICFGDFLRDLVIFLSDDWFDVTGSVVIEIWIFHAAEIKSSWEIMPDDNIVRMVVKIRLQTN